MLLYLKIKAYSLMTGARGTNDSTHCLYQTVQFLFLFLFFVFCFNFLNLFKYFNKKITNSLMSFVLLFDHIVGGGLLLFYLFLSF